jgi:hypothetical protein
VCASRAVVSDMFQKRVVHFCATDLKRVCAYFPLFRELFETCKSTIIYILQERRRNTKELKCEFRNI